MFTVWCCRWHPHKSFDKIDLPLFRRCRTMFLPGFHTEETELSENWSSETVSSDLSDWNISGQTPHLRENAVGVNFCEEAQTQRSSKKRLLLAVPRSRRADVRYARYLVHSFKSSVILNQQSYTNPWQTKSAPNICFREVQNILENLRGRLLLPNTPQKIYASWKLRILLVLNSGTSSPVVFVAARIF